MIQAKMTFTPQYKILLALARREAIALNQTHLDTEHLLLGLLRRGGAGAIILKAYGLDYNKAREVVIKRLRLRSLRRALLGRCGARAKHGCDRPLLLRR